MFGEVCVGVIVWGITNGLTWFLANRSFLRDKLQANNLSAATFAVIAATVSSVLIVTALHSYRLASIGKETTNGGLFEQSQQVSQYFCSTGEYVAWT